jgi:peptide-methionine (S)-S-oxide reductase
MKIRGLTVLGLSVAALWACAAARAESSVPNRSKSSGNQPASGEKAATENEPKLETATLGAGCFWCSEAVFQRIKGVESVVSGFSGGHVKNPSYEMVATGLTGHAEVVQITFDPEVISYEELLDIFWKSHDPTTLNKQGIDKGPQYRSVIFYHDKEQKEEAERSKIKAARSGRTSRKIVTEIAPFKEFYPAEDYHQNYFNNHPEIEYCQSVIVPKVNKVKKNFKDMLK